MRKKMFKVLAITMLLIVGISFTASAATWSKMVTTTQKICAFTITEDGFLIPFPIVVSGAWNEYWNGTKGGWATLQPLYHCAVIHNVSPEIMGYIDWFGPSANYNDGQTNNTWNIVYPDDWVLMNPINEYNMGYNNPGTYYNNPSVTGYVMVYGSDLNQIQMVKSWNWTQ